MAGSGIWPEAGTVLRGTGGVLHNWGRAGYHILCFINGSDFHQECMFPGGCLKNMVLL